MSHTSRRIYQLLSRPELGAVAPGARLRRRRRPCSSGVVVPGFGGPQDRKPRAVYLDLVQGEFSPGSTFVQRWLPERAAALSWQPSVSTSGGRALRLHPRVNPLRKTRTRAFSSRRLERRGRRSWPVALRLRARCRPNRTAPAACDLRLGPAAERGLHRTPPRVTTLCARPLPRPPRHRSRRASSGSSCRGRPGEGARLTLALRC